MSRRLIIYFLNVPSDLRRIRAVNWSLPGRELDQALGEDNGQTWQI